MRTASLIITMLFCSNLFAGIISQPVVSELKCVTSLPGESYQTFRADDIKLDYAKFFVSFYSNTALPPYLRPDKSYANLYYGEGMNPENLIASSFTEEDNGWITYDFGGADLLIGEIYSIEMWGKYKIHTNVDLTLGVINDYEDGKFRYGGKTRGDATFEILTTPEPTTILLFGLGGLMLRRKH